MYKTTLRSRAGFTLIELLTVIAIIGILAAILFPAIGAAKKAASKANDLSNIRTIGQAALVYSSDNNDFLPDPSSASNPFVGGAYYAWFGLLAKAGNLTDPAALYSKLDDRYPATPVTGILDPTVAAKTSLLAAFTTSVPSYEVIGGLKASDPSTYPVAYTRGLKADGTWETTTAAKLGVYGADGGGMVVFIGGNVAQYKSIGTPAKLIQTNGNTTVNIGQCVPLSRTTVKLYGDGSYSTLGTAAGASPTAAGAAN